MILKSAKVEKLKIRIKTVLVSVGLSCLLFAQSSGSYAAENALPAASPELWRKEAPKLPAPRSFKLPAVEKFKLANGLSVQLVEDHRVPFTTVYCGIKAGSIRNSSRQRGLSNLVAAMLAEGSDKHTSKEIAESIDFIGGAFSALSGPDFVIVSASALSQYNERLISTLSEIVAFPTFPEDELNLKKANLLEELKSNRSKPDFLCNERFAKAVFGSHPYSLVAPAPELVAGASRRDLLQFHRKNYLPNISSLVIAGDFKAAEMKRGIEKYFSRWQSAKQVEEASESTPQQQGMKIYLVNRPGSVQSRIKMGNRAIKKTDPDFYALTVANQVLGGASTSRLFGNIRENKGYTYGAYSRISPQLQPGSFAAEAEVRTEVTAPAVQEFLYELERIRNLTPSEKELSDCKNYLVGYFQLGLETQNGLAQRLLEVELYGLPADYLEKYGERIMAVSATDLRRAARKYIDLDNLVLTVVGDGEKIKGDLGCFAPVSTYDTDGKPLD